MEVVGLPTDFPFSQLFGENPFNADFDGCEVFTASNFITWALRHKYVTLLYQFVVGSVV